MGPLTNFTKIGWITKYAATHISRNGTNITRTNARSDVAQTGISPVSLSRNVAAVCGQMAAITRMIWSIEMLFDIRSAALSWLCDAAHFAFSIAGLARLG